jgi:hypothetical protein
MIIKENLNGILTYNLLISNLKRNIINVEILLSLTTKVYHHKNLGNFKKILFPNLKCHFRYRNNYETFILYTI